MAEIFVAKNSAEKIRRKILFAEIRLKNSAEIFVAEIRLKKICGNFYARKFG
jgi:hypothetical protein